MSELTMLQCNEKPTTLQCSEKATPLRGRASRRGYRDVFQRQSAVLEVEIGLSLGPHYRHLTSADIIGNEAEYYSAESISAEETSRSQKGLVYAIPKNP